MTSQSRASTAAVLATIAAATRPTADRSPALRGRAARAARRARSAVFDTLEPRRLLCALPHGQQVEELTFEGNAAASSGPADIVWTNRGSPTNDVDRFNSVFGANAENARRVIDAVIAHFERMIGSFNYSDGSSNFNLSLSMASSGSSLGASASLTSTLNGKPKGGNVSMGRGNNGAGGGWFIDTTPNDHSEFLGNIVNAFSGDATPGGPASNLSDFYTVAAAEITHALGLFGTSTALTGFRSLTTNTNIADNAEGGGIGTFWVFRGPSIKHLLSSNNGGAGGSNFGAAIHSAGPNGSGITFQGDTYVGGQDIGNAVYEFGRRYIPNQVFSLIFRDSFGYSTVDPNQFGTFYAALNQTTGEVTVRGGQGTSLDNIVVSHDASAGTITVSVDVGSDVAGTGALPGPGNLPAWVSTFDASSVTGINIRSGDSGDAITIESLPAGVGVTVNGGLGNDTVHLGGDTLTGGLGNWGGQVTLTDDFGIDVISVNDVSSTAGHAFELTNNLVRRDGAPLASFTTYERVIFNGGSGADTFTITTPASTLRTTVNGGAGNDVIDVVETGAGADLLVNPSDGPDDVNVNLDGAGSARVLFNSPPGSGGYRSLSIGQGGSGVAFAGGARTVVVESLSIAGGGFLDLNDNALVVDYAAGAASPLGDVGALLAAGRNGGAWNGAGGINSTVASALTATNGLGFGEASAVLATFPATFAGVAVDDTAVLVRYTLLGDANLDRTVGIADFSALAGAFNASGTPAWSNGNFNYDSSVDIADFSLLAGNFNVSLPSEPARPSGMLAGAASAGGPFSGRLIEDVL